MKLAELLTDFPIQHTVPDLEVHSVTENSTKADAHTVFVCIRGANTDGHRFAPDAYVRGCRVFIAENDLPLADDAFILSVSDTRKALAMLACKLYENPSHRMHLIGITGTKGKTTTAQLLAHILNTNGTPCGYIGTNGITYGNAHIPTRNTTPDAVTLQKTLCDMLSAGVSAAVIEVSSQALMQYRVDGIHFETVLFTNLSPDHIGQNEHPNLEHYKACKHRLFTDFGAETAIYNADDPVALDMLKNTSAIKRLSCSVKDTEADFFATDVTLLRNGQMLGVAFTLHHEKKSLACSLPLIGTVNVGNALLAMTTANKVFEIPLNDAAEALSRASVAGRSELISLPSGACVIIDYAHNAASLRQLLSTLREYRPARLIVLFGSIGERAKMRRRELGEVAAELSDLAVLTSDNPGNEPPEQIIDEIANAFSGFSTPFLKIPNRATAIQTAIGLTHTGDILVLAGKGHETYQLIGNKKIPFCERSLVTEEIQRVLIK